jgi:hypothetical protein
MFGPGFLDERAVIGVVLRTAPVGELDHLQHLASQIQQRGMVQTPIASEKVTPDASRPG